MTTSDDEFATPCGPSGADRPTSVGGLPIWSRTSVLKSSLTRRVLSVRLTVLRGQSVECNDIASAIDYLIEEENSAAPRVRC